jgi:hypothetical protein
MHYEITRNSRRCCVSDRELRPGEVFYSVLIDAPGGTKRRDYAAENWLGPPADAIGFWKGRMPVDDKPTGKQPISDDTMLELFEQWEDAEDAEKLQLRYVLALLLIRRKALKLQDVVRIEQGEFLVVQLPRKKQTYQVRDPHLTEDQVQQVEQELTRLLESDPNNDSRIQP